MDGGFEVSLGCIKDGKRGAELEYNIGSRKNPEWEKVFIEFECDIEQFISFGAGRSSKERIYLDLRGLKNGKLIAKIIPEGYLDKFSLIKECE